MAWHLNLDRLRRYCSPAGELTLAAVEKYDSATLNAYDRNGLSDIPIRQTIQDLLTGEHHHPDIGFQYGYALELLCHFCGDRLANDLVYPLAIDQFEAIDRAWVQLGLSDILKMSRLVYGGAPVRLPVIDDFPTIGYLTAAECELANNRLFDEQGTPQFNLTSTIFPIPIVNQIANWISIAAEMQQGIICFYH
jgi:hypothetical protein